MAADWRAWRLIVVERERFRWQNWMPGPDGACCLVGEAEAVRVRVENTPQCLLTVYCGDVGLRGVRPANVAAWIIAARLSGWLRDVESIDLHVPNLSSTPKVVAPVRLHTDQSSH